MLRAHNFKFLCLPSQNLSYPTCVSFQQLNPASPHSYLLRSISPFGTSLFHSVELMQHFKQLIFLKKNAFKLWVVRIYWLALHVDDIAFDTDGYFMHSGRKS